jgi:hypothetical protein
MKQSFMKIGKSRIRKMILWQGEGISTFGLIGSCCQRVLCSPPITRGRRRFDSPGFVPFKKLQSHFMKLDLLSVFSNANVGLQTGPSKIPAGSHASG